MQRDRCPTTLLLALCLGVMAAGCQTETTSPDAGATDAGATDAGAIDAGAPDAGDTTVPIPADELHGELLRALCKAFPRCHANNGLEFADEAGCLAAVDRRAITGVAFNGLPQLQAAIAAGDVTVDYRAARRCVDALATAACSTLVGSDHLAFALVPECAGVFTGKLAKDADCVLDEACAGNSHCARATIRDCTGKCTPRGEGPCEGAAACLPGQFCGQVVDFVGTCGASAEGTACNSDADCIDGRECVEGSRGRTCVTNTLPKEGEACTRSCAAGLYCPTGAAPKCTPTPKVGESCFGSGRNCAPDAVCTARIPPGTCRALPGDGQPCTPRPYRCEDGLECDTSGATPTCRASRVSLGGTCGGDRICAAGLFCFNQDHTCHTLPTLGEECPGAFCAPGLRCIPEGETVRCGPIGQLNESCFADEQCADGLHCPQNVCVPLLEEGAECTGNGHECAAGLECDARTGQLKCTPTTIGKPCVNNACAPNAWCEPTVVTPEMVMCEAPPAVEGAACAGRCAAGFDCRPENDGNHCRALGQTGDACSQSWPNPCADGLRCEAVGNEGVCLGQKLPGESCTHPLECGGRLSSFQCVEGKCAPRPRVGEPCAKATLGPVTLDLCDSFAGWCDTSGEVPTCKAFLAAGAACSGENSCGEIAGIGFCDGTCLASRKAECSNRE